MKNKNLYLLSGVLLLGLIFPACENVYVQDILRDNAILDNIGITAYTGGSPADINYGLEPVFSPDRREYRAKVPALTDRIIITGTPHKDTALSYRQVKPVPGPEKNSGEFDFPVTGTDALNSITVALTVRRDYMDDAVYTIVINRKQPGWIDKLVIKSGTASPPDLPVALDFIPEQLEYTAVVPTGTQCISFAAHFPRDRAKVVYTQDNDPPKPAVVDSDDETEFSFPASPVDETFIRLQVSFPGTNPPDTTEYTALGEESIRYTIRVKRYGTVKAAAGMEDYFAIGVIDPPYVKQGESVAFSVTPPFGHTVGAINCIPLGGGALPYTRTGDVYTFLMPAEDVTLSASWNPIPSISTAKYVRGGGTGDKSGSSWANASGNLQKMIDIYGSTHEIWIAEGTLTPDWSGLGADSTWASAVTPEQRADSRNWAFVLKEGAKIYGGFTGTETARSVRDIAAAADSSYFETHQTILSGDLGSTGSASHVVIAADITGDTLLDGLTISGGSCTTGLGSDITINGKIIAGNSGGGVYTVDCDSSLVFSRLTITNNRAAQGGGVCNDNSSPTLDGLLISGNTASGYGGGISNSGNSSPLISGTIISSNTASGGGGGLYNDGSSSPTLIGAAIRNNQGNYGGGILNNKSTQYMPSSTVKLINVEISGNTANTGGGIRTGLVYGIRCNLILTNVTISGNIAKDTPGGGGIFIYSPTTANNTISLDNVIISGNIAASNGRNIYWNLGMPTVVFKHSVIGESPTDRGVYRNSTTPLDDTYYDNTCLAALPDDLFVSPASRDYRLKPDVSNPAINVGDNAAYTGNGGSPTDKDLAGNPRFNGIIDIGAYELYP
ncbi:MAG: cadherin-like beta sandwich domain-containing protein [Treponema sp.]|jgi:hypothetical protein|nr:cadherin-like beta sandwich domain-containing protein [Treponema sp.]